jgi:hypothetical protein
MIRPLIRWLLSAACCIGVATGCSGVDSGGVSGSTYYGTSWYIGDGDCCYDDVDIDAPDRPARPDGGSPPKATQLPSGGSGPSIPSTPRAAPRGGGGGRRR